MTRIFLDLDINDKEKSKRLEEISLADVLLFPDCRMETVVGINNLFKELYTERIIPNSEDDYKKLPGKRQEFVYELTPSGIITSTSKGRIYDSKKIGKKEWEILTNLDLNKVPATEGAYK
jgi:hypothetical protein